MHGDVDGWTDRDRSINFMCQLIKALAIKQGSLSSVLKTHVREELG